ncbi:hypothetical protein KI387_001585, partial [Taxus chinensis]
MSPPSTHSQENRPQKRKTIQSFFPSSTLATASASMPTQNQPTLDNHWKKQYKEATFEYIARWWYDADIPFNAARSPYYQPMFDSIVVTGKGFKGPSMHDLRGSLLKKEVASIDEYLKGCKASRAKTRCTIMLDGWSDGKNRTIINFLASCPQGTMFLKSVDASDRVKDANLLFELLDEIVLEVGVENVVQIITDNASNYVLAAEIVKVAEPLVKVLRLVDGKKLAMGYIYEAMDQAKEQRRATFKDRVMKYGPIWEIIDNRWNNQLHRPIHAAGYFLNLKYHYRAQLGEDQTGEVKDGLYECLECMVPDEMQQLEVHRQINFFNRATCTFGKNLAKIARNVDQPAQLVRAWNVIYNCDYLAFACLVFLYG